MQINSLIVLLWTYLVQKIFYPSKMQKTIFHVSGLYIYIFNMYLNFYTEHSKITFSHLLYLIRLCIELWGTFCQKTL